MIEILHYPYKEYTIVPIISLGVLRVYIINSSVP